MPKLSQKTPNKTEQHLEQIAQLFPNVMSEGEDGKRVVDFDLLRQMLSDELVEGADERYRLDWVGKRASLLKANSAIDKTLRPCREESVEFDTTENLYIEGDNFEVLKLIQESYLGKVKMVYIDPPYNTGKDFVYRDNFTASKEDYEEEMGLRDEEENKLFKNTDSNGRFHSDWLSMMYERLLVSRDLLKDDGVIFISIDDNEVHNLRKICDEVFGEGNFVGNITWEKRTKAQNTLDAKNMFQSKIEYILIYKKNMNKIRFKLEVSGNKIYDEKDEKGIFRYKRVEEMSSLGMRGRETMIYPILGIYPSEKKQWKIGEEAINIFLDRKDIILLEDKIFMKIRPDDEDAKKYYPFWSHFFNKEVYGTAESGKTELSQILETKEHGFETVKPTQLIKKLLFHLQDTENEIILDFFSGSSTTADAVMQLNAEDGGNRKFIMIQVDEPIDNKKYSNITEIAKERIKRAGTKINEELKTKNEKLVDIGFRVLKVDSSNMKDVYYHPTELGQNALAGMESNIKADRDEMDLLFATMLELGVELSLKITPQSVDGTTIYVVAEGELVACFADNISTKVIDAIKALTPLQVVLKDGCFANDNEKINGVESLSKVANVSVL